MQSHKSYGFTSNNTKSHIEWLLWSQTKQMFYTIITPEFGGGGSLDSAIISRKTLGLLKMGERRVADQKEILGYHHMHPCNLNNSEIESQFTLYGNYKHMFSK